MTQYNPPGQYPPNYGQPVPGYGMAPGTPQKTSVAAIVSLITGILGCLIVTGIIAVITGIIGFINAGKPGMKGRGFAITGIILGLVFSLISVGLIAGGVWGIGKFKEMAAQQVVPMVNAVIDGDFAKAKQYTNLTDAELEAFRGQMDGWGRITTASINGFDAKKVNGRDTVVLKGTATFTTAGAKDFEAIFDDGGQGQLKIIGLEFK